MDLKEFLNKHFSKEMLTEDAQGEIQVMFEAMVSEGINQKLENEKRLLEEKYTTDLTEFKSELESRLSDYLEDTFKEWFEENKVERISEIKVDMAENIMGQLTEAFKSNSIDIEKEDIDNVVELEDKLKESKEKLDSRGNENIELKKQIFEYEKALAFEKMTENISLSNKEKLINLVEDIETKDIESFKSKLNIIKENFVEKGTENLNEETKEIENPSEKLTEGKEEKKSSVDKYAPKYFV